MLINSSDRAIRHYHISYTENRMELELQNRFVDAVNRIQWSHCCLSADGEYVVGSNNYFMEKDIK